MRVLRIAVVTAFSCLVATRVLSAENASAESLSFLTGLWRGTSSSGATAEELISTPDGGVMLSAGREFKDGKCVFYDLVVFASPKGVLTLIPHPGGKPSPDVFPLLAFDAAAKRATFQNNAHDFPKKFVYELTEPNRLRITLTGEIKGVPVTETYNLTKTP
jgi:hypothetical protein